MVIKQTLNSGWLSSFRSETRNINLSFLSLFVMQLMIVTGASISFLLGTVITWRNLALTGQLS